MAEDVKKDRPGNLPSILIALAAVTGALVSWYGTRVGSSASSEDGKAITAALNEASGEASIASDIFGFETYTRQFQLHRDGAKAVRDEAMKNPDVPDRWLDEWQGESIRAQARLNQLNTDFLKREDGRWTFDREKYYRTLRSQMALEKPLDAGPFIERAEEKRRKANLLISLSALFAAAIFFFTIVLKTEWRRGSLFLAAGIALYLAGAGAALWLIFR